ncbi:MAG: hypothetical protein QM754_03335 [Tepidisphaeraceae bacterium]
MQVLGIAAAGWEGDILGEALPVSAAGFAFEAGAWIARLRVLVNAGIENRGVVVKRCLRSVPVVNVEIDDRYAFKTEALLGVSRRNGDVIEQAKPHRPVRLGMMAGRANGSEASFDSPLKHRRGAGHRCPDAQAGDIEAFGAGKRVGIDHAAAV